MKTCEQVAADVLARRDAYLEKRAVRRRQAKRYAAASALVCAAVFAAAGLFRSGVLNDALPVSLNDPAQSDRAGESESASSHGNDVGLPEGGTGARETTVPRAVHYAETTAAIDLSGKIVYVFPSVTEPASAAPTEEPGTAPAREREPETTAPHGVQTTQRQPETTTNRPIADPTKKTPTRLAPAVEPPTTDKQEITTENGNAGAAPSAVAPSDEPETEDITSAQPEEAYDNVLYVTYNGALYLAEDVPPAAIPAGARTLEQKDALLYGETLLDAGLSELLSPSGSAFAGADPAQPNEGPPAVLGRPDASEESEPVSTRITLLSLPGASADARIGVTSEGFEGKMFVLEYVCELEELIQEDIQ